MNIVRGKRLRNALERQWVEVPKPTGGRFESHAGFIVGKVGGQWVVYDDVCDHNGGRLALSSNGVSALCPMHHWRLNLTLGKYDNGCVKTRLEFIEHPEALSVERVVERFAEVEREGLTVAPITFRFNAHASVSVTIDDLSLITDPWLDGSCFATGWWHLHPPDTTAIQRLVDSNIVYVSHNHPDHLHFDTLEKHVPKDKLFLVPRFESGSVERLLRERGFQNIVVADFLEEITFESRSGARVKAVIVKAGDGRDDSSLFLFTQRHSVLFAVDTNMPNKWVLCEVDVLFTPFAGGASGFPSRIDHFSDAEKVRIADTNRSLILTTHVTRLIRTTKPRVVVPYAGYFTESQRDADVTRVNRKNTRQDALAFIERRFPSVVGIDPIENGEFTVDGAEVKIGAPAARSAPNIDAADAAEEIRRFSADAPELTLDRLDRLGQAFMNADFVEALTVAIVPCAADFTPLDACLVIDFSKGGRQHRLIEGPVGAPPEIVAALRETTENNIEVLLVRSDSLRGLIHKGLPLEDLSIGFQVRMYRDPNVYNFRFWNHFTNVHNVRLPA
jgi:CMP-N-acetylneuraminate monooxygenase